MTHRFGVSKLWVASKSNEINTQNLKRQLNFFTIEVRESYAGQAVLWAEQMAVLRSVELELVQFWGVLASSEGEWLLQ